MQNLLSFKTAKQQKIPHPKCLNLGGDYSFIIAPQVRGAIVSKSPWSEGLRAEQDRLLFFRCAPIEYNADTKLA